MGSIFSLNILKSVLDILYPPLCLHCEAPLEKQKKIFCESCLEQLSLIEGNERCSMCFAEELPCVACASQPQVMKSLAVACPPIGPVRTLSSYLKKGNTRFAPAAASLMALQCIALQWPIPDLIVPLPSHLWTRCKKGCDISALLAQEMARLFNTTSASMSSTSWDRCAFLEKGEFQMAFRLIERKKEKLMGQRILLVGLHLERDVFRKVSEILLEGFPREIYGLALY